jgi:hypothetical protein
MAVAEQAEVTLPVDPSTFKDFVSAILGKPQTLSRIIFGAFELKLDDILNIFRIVDQRVNQQNKANLIQFSTKVIYSDNSSRLLSSYDEANTYAEPRDVIPTSIHLQISYLIRFNDPQSPDGLGKPEKQEIEVSIVTSGKSKYRMVNFENSVIFPFDAEGYFEINIKHTAITWGSDIDSLLAQHIKTLLIEEPKMKVFARKHSTGTGFGIGGLFFLICVAFSLINTNKINNIQNQRMNEIIANNNFQTIESLNNKMNFVIEKGLSISGNNQALVITLFLIFTFVTSIALAVWISSSAENYKPSYLLLTKAAEKNKINKDKREITKWRSFIISIVSSILLGIISNYIFTFLCSQKILNP